MATAEKRMTLNLPDLKVPLRSSFGFWHQNLSYLKFIDAMLQMKYKMGIHRERLAEELKEDSLFCAFDISENISTDWKNTIKWMLSPENYQGHDINDPGSLLKAFQLRKNHLITDEPEAAYIQYCTGLLSPASSHWPDELVFFATLKRLRKCVKLFVCPTTVQLEGSREITDQFDEMTIHFSGDDECEICSEMNSPVQLAVLLGCIFCPVIEIQEPNEASIAKILSSYDKGGHFEAAMTEELLFEHENSEEDDDKKRRTRAIHFSRGLEWIQCDVCKRWRLWGRSEELPEETSPWQCGQKSYGSKYEAACTDPPISLYLDYFSELYACKERLPKDQDVQIKGDMLQKSRKTKRLNEVSTNTLSSWICSVEGVVLDLPWLFLDVRALGGIDCVPSLGRLKDMAMDIMNKGSTNSGNFLKKRYNNLFRTVYQLNAEERSRLQEKDESAKIFIPFGKLPEFCHAEQFIEMCMQHLRDHNEPPTLLNTVDMHESTILARYGLSKKTVNMVKQRLQKRSTLSLLPKQQRHWQAMSAENALKLLQEYKKILERDVDDIGNERVNEATADLIQVLGWQRPTDGPGIGEPGEQRQGIVVLGDTGNGKSFMIDILMRLSAGNSWAYKQRLKEQGNQEKHSYSEWLEGCQDSRDAELIIQDESIISPIVTQIVRDRFASSEVPTYHNKKHTFLLPSGNAGTSTTATNIAIRRGASFHIVIKYQSPSEILQIWRLASQFKKKSREGYKLAEENWECNQMTRDETNAWVKAAITQIKELFDFKTEAEAVTYLDTLFFASENEDDIPNLPQTIKSILGRSFVFALTGTDPLLHRLFVRRLLHHAQGLDDKISGNFIHSSSKPCLHPLFGSNSREFGKNTRSFVERIIVYVDCFFAPSHGLELVDTPGTNDNHPIKRLVLENELGRAKQVICVASKDLSVGTDMLKRLASFIAPSIAPIVLDDQSRLDEKGKLNDQPRLDEDVKLKPFTVVMNWEKEQWGDIESIKQSNNDLKMPFSKLIENYPSYEEMKDTFLMSMQSLKSELVEKLPENVEDEWVTQHLEKTVNMILLSLVEAAAMLMRTDDDHPFNENDVKLSGLAGILGQLEMFFWQAIMEHRETVIKKCNDTIEILKSILQPQNQPRLVVSSNVDNQVKKTWKHVSPLFKQFKTEFIRLLQTSFPTEETLLKQIQPSSSRDARLRNRKNPYIPAVLANLSKGMLIGSENYATKSVRLQTKCLDKYRELWSTFSDSAKKEIFKSLDINLNPSETNKFYEHFENRLKDDFETELIKPLLNKLDEFNWTKKIMVKDSMPIKDVFFDYLEEVLGDTRKKFMVNLKKCIRGPNNSGLKRNRLRALIQKFLDDRKIDQQKVQALIERVKEIQKMAEDLCFPLDNVKFEELGVRMAEYYRREHIVDRVASEKGVSDDFLKLVCVDLIDTNQSVNIVQPSNWSELVSQMMKTKVQDDVIFSIKNDLMKQGLRLLAPSNRFMHRVNNIFSVYLETIQVDKKHSHELRKVLRHLIQLHAGEETMYLLGLDTIESLKKSLQNPSFQGDPWCALLLPYLVFWDRPLNLYVPWLPFPCRIQRTFTASEPSQQPIKADAIAFLGMDSMNVPLFACVGKPTQSTISDKTSHKNERKKKIELRELSAHGSSSVALNLATGESCDTGDGLLYQTEEKEVESILDSSDKTGISEAQSINAFWTDQYQSNLEQSSQGQSHGQGIKRKLKTNDIEVSAKTSRIESEVDNDQMDVDTTSSKLDEMQSVAQNISQQDACANHVTTTTPSTSISSFVRYPFRMFDKANWETKGDSGFRIWRGLQNINNQSLDKDGQIWTCLSEEEFNRLGSCFWRFQLLFQASEQGMRVDRERRTDSEVGKFAAESVLAVFDPVAGSNHSSAFVTAFLQELNKKLYPLPDGDLLQPEIQLKVKGKPTNTLSRGRFNASVKILRSLLDATKSAKGYRKLKMDETGTATGTLLSLIRTNELPQMMKSMDATNKGEFVVHAACIGNCQWMLLRWDDDKKEYSLVYQSTPTYYSQPSQGVRIRHQFGWGQGMEINSQICSPKILPVNLGDIIILASDGFFDTIKRELNTDAITFINDRMILHDWDYIYREIRDNAADEVTLVVAEIADYSAI